MCEGGQNENLQKNPAFPENKQPARQADRQTARVGDRQTDRQTNGQTGRQAEKAWMLRAGWRNGLLHPNVHQCVYLSFVVQV